MKLKKIFTLALSSLLLTSLVACGAPSESTETKEEPTSQEVMVVDKEKKEITMLTEVNGKYFTESTRHGVVFKDGSNGEKSVLRGHGILLTPNR